MNAIEYLKEWNRMCGSHINGCRKCPISAVNNGTNKLCGDFQKYDPEKAVEIVEKWSKENPPKTILQDFLEKHPNARTNDDGIPNLCPCILGYKLDFNPNCFKHNCDKCWNTQLK